MRSPDMHSARSLSTHYLLTVLLLIAAALRLWALPNLPPGIEHDEVAEVLIAEEILKGRHAIFFQEAYGQEPLFLYLVAGALLLFGRHVLALRFVTAAVGILTVAAGARWTRRLFGPRTSLVTAGGLAVMLWPVFWSRVGLRGMLLPLTLSLGADALWAALRGSRQPSSHSGPVYSWRRAVLAGVWFGMSAYTYLAARGVPLLLLGFAILWLLLDREVLWKRWRVLLLASLVAALIAAPLVLYLVGNKEAQTRVYQVDAPLRALRAGDPGPVLASVGRIAGMFSIAGDATDRNNLSGRPVFAEPIWAALFYAGLLVALVKFRDVRYSFVLLWLGVMVVPSLVTTEAPNFVRTLGALPPVMALPGLGADAALRWLARRAQPWVGRGVLAGALVLNAALTVHAYGVRWPRSSEVQFVWQVDLAAAAAWLDEHDEVQEVTLAGLSTTTMDAPSLDLLLQRSDVRDRWCDTGSPLSSAGAVLFPANGGRLLVPMVVPLAAPLERYLDAEIAAETVNHERFREFVLDRTQVLEPSLDVAFEGNVHLIGLHNVPPALPSGGRLSLVSMWRAGAGDLEDLKVFVHLVNEASEVVAQHDGLDCPSYFWREGDVIVQLHQLTLPERVVPETHTLRVGLYPRHTLEPYRTLDGNPFYEVGIDNVEPGF